MLLRLFSRPSPLRRNWLMFRLKPSMVVIETSYISVVAKEVLTRCQSMPWTSLQMLTYPLLIAMLSAPYELTGPLELLSGCSQRSSSLHRLLKHQRNLDSSEREAVHVRHSSLPQDEGPGFGWLKAHSHPCNEPFQPFGGAIGILALLMLWHSGRPWRLWLEVDVCQICTGGPYIPLLMTWWACSCIFRENKDTDIMQTVMMPFTRLLHVVNLKLKLL